MRWGTRACLVAAPSRQIEGLGTSGNVPTVMIAHALYFQIRGRTWTYTASELFNRLLRNELSFLLLLHISSHNSSSLCNNRSQCRGVFLMLRRDNKYFARRSSPTTESLTAPAYDWKGCYIDLALEECNNKIFFQKKECNDTNISRLKLKSWLNLIIVYLCTNHRKMSRWHKKKCPNVLPVKASFKPVSISGMLGTRTPGVSST
jgi:hypothetical protein